MSEIDLVAGNRFRLYRQDATAPEGFKYVALGATLNFIRSTDFEDAYAPDADDPLKVPVRKNSARSSKWDLTFSGQVDAKLLEKIESDYESGAAYVYQIMTDMPLAKGGKIYEGPIVFESLEIGMQNRGFVTFTAKCRGDGSYTMTPAAV